MEIGRIGASDILSYRKAESERVSSVSVNIAIKFLRMVFDQANRDGLLVDNPVAGISQVKKTGTSISRRPFTLDEVSRLLATADAEWRSLVILGFYTGARLGDLARLTWMNVDLLHGELRFVTGKTGRRQIIPLAKPLRRHLESLSAGDDLKQALHPRAFAIVQKQGKKQYTFSPVRRVDGADGFGGSQVAPQGGRGRRARHPSADSLRAALEAAEALQTPEKRGGELTSGWDFVPGYLAKFCHGKSPKTLTRYRQAWHWISLFLAEHRIRHPRDMRFAYGQQLVDWRKAFKKRHTGSQVCHNTAVLDVKVFGMIMQRAV